MRRATPILINKAVLLRNVVGPLGEGYLRIAQPPNQVTAASHNCAWLQTASVGSMTGILPLSTSSHRRTAEVRMITTQTIMITVQIESTYPWMRSAGLLPIAFGQKLSRILM